MEQLIEGPKNTGEQATIPTETKLITLSTVDGVCYVNFDETFFNQNQEISEQVVLYSIVDSLTELSTIDRVQLSVNGDTTGKVRFTYNLSSMYEEDLSLVMVEENTEEGIESTE
jgi:germination protein M